MDAAHTTVHSARDLPKGRMRRLVPEWYRGQAFVHWSMTIARRRTGWLDQEFHFRFRECHLHALSRFGVLCPVYCLMPDHIHLLWIGLGVRSDQSRAIAFLRRFTNELLARGGAELQKQAWDVVLRDRDRERDAVVRTAHYIAGNPVRAGLATTAAEWPYSGAQAAGYPEFDWRMADFAARAWRVFDAETERRRSGAGDGSGEACGRPER